MRHNSNYIYLLCHDRPTTNTRCLALSNNRELKSDIRNRFAFTISFSGSGNDVLRRSQANRSFPVHPIRKSASNDTKSGRSSLIPRADRPLLPRIFLLPNLEEEEDLHTLVTLLVKIAPGPNRIHLGRDRV